MLKVENIEVTGWEATIRGMRNPKNSWNLSDTMFITDDGDYYTLNGESGPYYGNNDDLEIGPNDHKLMMTLASAGPVHGKFRRMIVVTMDITAPLYWWKEFDTYKVGTVANSCSTMHKIHAKEFTMEDFSCEHLLGNCDGIELVYPFGKPDDPGNKGLGDFDVLCLVIKALNKARELFLETGDKKYWWWMIQLLPTSYNQNRTVQLSYEVAANIHQYRRHHKLDEWHTLCDAIENLPYSEIILCSEKPEPTPDKTYITDHDRIVMSAYTGILMCPFDDYHKFIEETLGRPVFTHELAEEDIHKELQERLKPEFLKIISEQPGKKV